MKSRLANAALFFALFTAIGLLFFSYYLLGDLARHVTGTALPRFIEEMTGAYTAVIVLPIVIWTLKRVPFSAAKWPLALLAQFGGMIVYTVGHTTLMAISRGVIFPLVGLGTYDYGIMRFRYPMEASQDVIIYAIVVGFAYVFDRLRQAREAEMHTAELQTRLAQAQLDNLKLQLHPHFLFNTLNAISSVMYEDVAKADAMLAQLSDFLRLVLDSSGVHEVSLERELTVERMYVDIMKTRLESRLNLLLDVEPGLHDAAIPFMVLQPLIENSIKHGLPPGSNTLDIAVVARKEGATTVIAVRDNGVGLRSSGMPEHHGLANVRSRLAHMYGSAAALTVMPAIDRGTQATLRIPFAQIAVAQA